MRVLVFVNVAAVFIGAWLLSDTVGVRAAIGIGLIAWAIIPLPVVFTRQSKE